MLMKPRSKQTVLSFAVSAALGVGGSSGWAQELDEETVDTAVEKEIETVVVTGSRIKRDGYSSASPMDVISAESAVIEGIGDVGSLLQTTTIASGSAQVTSATSSAFVQEGRLVRRAGSQRPHSLRLSAHRRGAQRLIDRNRTYRCAAASTGAA